MVEKGVSAAETQQRVLEFFAKAKMVFSLKELGVKIVERKGHAFDGGERSRPWHGGHDGRPRRQGQDWSWEL